MFGELDAQQLLDDIQASIELVQNGNMKDLEAMLVGQAKALQTMFVSMANRANNQQYLKQFTTYMNLALKAQTQSRATIQALVELKYPRQVIVTQQANIANGHQQVNNSAAASGQFSEQYAYMHAGKNQSETNKVLESNHDNTKDTKNQPQRLDSRTTKTAISSHTPLETVAAVNRG
ncbi:hypothetical protein [Formosimonas limnophila]|nr:hypothetical protein [Formosimonas limnophila]